MRSYFTLVIVVVLSFSACSSSSLITDKIYSNELGEEWEFCIYRPENFNPEQVYPVIFATDGQIVESGKYKSILDKLIKSETIPPVVLIGAYSNEHVVSSDGMELRYYEYIENDCNEPQIAGRFQTHFKFFSVEIRDSVLAKYSIQPTLKNIYFSVVRMEVITVLHYMQNIRICFPTTSAFLPWEHKPIYSILAARPQPVYTSPTGAKRPSLHLG